LTAEIVIPIGVSVDAQGNVTAVRMPERRGLEGALASQAREAARGWKFQPARLNGKAVASEQTLNFRFGGR
jgi:TonB family protein